MTTPPTAPKSETGIEHDLPNAPGMWTKTTELGEWQIVVRMRPGHVGDVRLEAIGWDERRPILNYLMEHLPRGHWHKAGAGVERLRRNAAIDLAFARKLGKPDALTVVEALAPVAAELAGYKHVVNKCWDLAKDYIAASGETFVDFDFVVGRMLRELTVFRHRTESAEARLVELERDKLKLKPPHKCKPIARIHNMQPGREWWLGKLTERVPEWPNETHCLHIKTPLKDIVLLCNMGDLQGLTVLCNIPFPIVNETWKQRMEQAYRRAALTPQQESRP